MSVNGASLDRDENKSHVTVYYQLNDNLQFEANMLWTFMPSQYFSETLPSSLVYQRVTTKIWDNKSMILIGVSWNFHKGKGYDVCVVSCKTKTTTAAGSEGGIHILEL